MEPNAAIGIAVYLNALGHPFLFDDGGAMVDNQTIRSLWASFRGGPDQFPEAAFRRTVELGPDPAARQGLEQPIAELLAAH